MLNIQLICPSSRRKEPIIDFHILRSANMLPHWTSLHNAEPLRDTGIKSRRKSLISAQDPTWRVISRLKAPQPYGTQKQSIARILSRIRNAFTTHRISSQCATLSTTWISHEAQNLRTMSYLAQCANSPHTTTQHAKFTAQCANNPRNPKLLFTAGVTLVCLLVPLQTLIDVNSVF